MPFQMRFIVYSSQAVDKISNNFGRSAVSLR